MTRPFTVLWLGLLATGCLDLRGYGPDGYHCAGDVDCPGDTYCFRDRCAVKTATPPRPDATNTGVPPDTVLTASGPLTLTQDGQVLDGLDIDGCVVVRANDVTLRRSRIRCGGYFGIEMQNGARGLLLEDVELDGTGFTNSRALVLSAGTARRLNIHHSWVAVTVSSGARLEQSYLHDLVSQTPIGVDTQGGSQVVVTGNEIDLAPHTKGWAVFLTGATVPLAHVEVSQNWLNGGDYPLWLGGGSAGSSDVVARKNRIGRVFGSGPIHLISGAVQFETVFDDTGEAVSP
ncbi:MAG: hypothetical protein IPJ65_35340 [Archangiaceae bacterium]|nr:hypothetical protein [Archangiaceae bacterium]